MSQNQNGISSGFSVDFSVDFFSIESGPRASPKGLSWDARNETKSSLRAGRLSFVRQSCTMLLNMKMYKPFREVLY